MGGVTRSQPRQLAYAQITANQTGISTLADITGLSITFTPGVRPVWVELYIPSIKQLVATGLPTVYISDSSNNAIETVSHDLTVNLTTGPIIVRRRLTILTPGTSYTFKGRASTSGASATLTVNAGSDAIPSIPGPAFIRAYGE